MFKWVVCTAPCEARFPKRAYKNDTTSRCPQTLSSVVHSEEGSTILVSDIAITSLADVLFLLFNGNRYHAYTGVSVPPYG